MKKIDIFIQVRYRQILVYRSVDFFLLIVPYGLIIYAKIKTQCASKHVLELVGSPAVLCYAG